MQIFLDNHRSCRVASFALDAFQPYVEQHWCSPYLGHSLSEKAAKQIPHLMQPIYELLQAEGTEPFSLGKKAHLVENLIYSYFFEKAQKEGKNHFFVFSKQEFLPLWERLEEQGCFIFEMAKTPQGQLDLEQLKKEISLKTALVMTRWVEPFSGVIQPIESLSQLCQEKGVDLYVDVNFALGKTLLMWKDLPISWVHLEAWPLHGMPGVSLLLGKNSQFFSQDVSLDLFELAMLSSCARQAGLFLNQATLEIGRLRDFWEREIQKKLPETEVLFHKQMRLPNVSLLCFPKISIDTLAYYSQEKGLYIAEENLFLTHFLKSCGLEDKAPFTASFVFSRFTTLPMVETGLEKLFEQIKRLKQLSEDL